LKTSINTKSIQELINKNKQLIVISFFSEQSGGSFIMKRILAKVKKKFTTDEVCFFEIDIDKDNTLAKELNIRKTPTIIIYRDQEIREWLKGIISNENLELTLKVMLELDTIQITQKDKMNKV